MITENNKKLARWAMDFALKNGCQACAAGISTGSNTSFELRDGKMDKLQQSSSNGLILNLYVDGRFASYSTNRLEQKELEPFIKNGIDTTRYLAKDEAKVLPDPSRYYKGGKPDLKLYDATINLVDADTKVQLAKAVADEVMGKDQRIISVDSSYNDGEFFSYRLTSNGFEGEARSSWFSLGSGVAVKGEGETRPSDGWTESSLFYNTLTKTGIGAEALRRVLSKLGQQKIKSGKYTMLLDNTVSSRLLSPVIQAANGSGLQQKNSFLLNKLNEKFGSDRLTLIDDPHVPMMFGSKYFDGEGVATQKRNIFESGALKTYFIDTFNSKKLKMEPTVSGPSRLVLQPGTRGFDQILADIKHGILVTGFNGGNCNSSSGDFSYGIEGFLIENGQKTTPLNEMNVTGNMHTLWLSLAEAGNDPRKNSAWQIPTLVFEGIDFSGL